MEFVASGILRYYNVLIQLHSTVLNLNNNFSVASLNAITECTLLNFSLCSIFFNHRKKNCDVASAI